MKNKKPEISSVTISVSRGATAGTCNCIGGACTMHPKGGYIIETAPPAPLPPPQEPTAHSTCQCGHIRMVHGKDAFNEFGACTYGCSCPCEKFVQKRPAAGETRTEAEVNLAKRLGTSLEGLRASLNPANEKCYDAHLVMLLAAESRIAQLEQERRQFAMIMWQVLGAEWGMAKGDEERCRIMNWFYAITKGEEIDGATLFPLKLDDKLATAEAALTQAQQERDEKWVEAIQGAIGQMGRTGDRQYFDFCMCLIWQEAEDDGLLAPDPKHKKWIEDLSPIIAKKKHLLCTAEKEISELRAQKSALMEALQPFAETGNKFTTEYVEDGTAIGTTMQNFQRAARVYEQAKEKI